MLKYKCLVLDHDDTVVQSEATVNYPCFCRYLETYRPGESISLADYVGDCNKMAFVDMCKTRFAMTDAELEIEYGFWKDYAKTHPGENARADVIVVDPPRKGCDEDCLNTMVQMQPKRIVYVSCDSATLARDVKYLEEYGYKLMQARIFDNFPQSVHVESVVWLAKK